MFLFDEKVLFRGLGNMSDESREDLMKFLGAMAHQVIAITNKCESPIEQKLGASLCCSSMVNRSEYEVIPQYEVTIDGKTYRADFLVSTKPPNQYEVLVECDGHDFHERTKQQAQRDKSRDRALAKAGFKVLRFTGSEIMQDSIKCAHQVISVLQSDLKRTTSQK